MPAITRRTTSPFSELLSWFENEPRGLGLAPYVRMEDFVEDGTWVLRAELPGIDPDKDVELSVVDDVLTIRGERREEKKEKNRHELHYGSFERSVRLPVGTRTEDITAEYKDGVLELRVPIPSEEPTATHIPVQRRDT